MNEMRIHIEKIRETVEQPDYKTFKHLLSLTPATRKMLVMSKKLGESVAVTQHNGLLAILEFCYIMNESTRYIVVEKFEIKNDSIKLICENCYKEIAISWRELIGLDGGCSNCSTPVLKREVIPELLSGMYNLITSYKLGGIIEVISSYSGIDESYQVVYTIRGEEYSSDIREMPEILTKEYIKLRNNIDKSECAKVRNIAIANNLNCKVNAMVKAVTSEGLVMREDLFNNKKTVNLV